MDPYEPDAIAERGLELHRLIARKLQANPALLGLVRANLASRDAPAHSSAYRQAWREAVDAGLAATLAAALDPSERGATMRSCTPLGCVLTDEERARFFEDWWTRRKPMADTPAFLDRIDENAPLPPHFTLPRD